MSSDRGRICFDSDLVVFERDSPELLYFWVVVLSGIIADDITAENLISTPHAWLEEPHR
jgi:hypothetical protein